MKPIFSLIVPTRERPELFEGLLKSIIKSTRHPEWIDLTVTTDTDDPYRNQYKKICLNCKDIKVLLITRDRSDKLCEDYYNFMARMAQGAFVWALNDDIWDITMGWDTLALEVINNFHSKYIWGNTGILKDHATGFPIVSRELINLFGYLFHPKIYLWSNTGLAPEVRMHHICGRQGCVADMSAIRYEHKHSQAIGDSVRNNMVRIKKEFGHLGPSNQEEQEDEQKLKRALNEEKINGPE